MNSLFAPLRAFARESYKLESAFQLHLDMLGRSGNDDTHARYVCEMCVIRLLDSWSRFNREVIILSAGARALTRGGTQLGLAPNVSGRYDVLKVLAATYHKPPRYEPRWAIAAQSIDVAQRLQIQNFGMYAAAVGASNSPADELRYVRNFMAHRTEEARRCLTQHPVFGAMRNYSVEQTAGMFMSGGVSRFVVWTQGLNAVAQAATI